MRLSQLTIVLPALLALFLAISAGAVPGLGPEPALAQAAQAPTANNDDLLPVVLGTSGVVLVAGIAVTLGYLYRRQIGLVGHYEDGFTPRDPRDHIAH